MNIKLNNQISRQDITNNWILAWEILLQKLETEWKENVIKILDSRTKSDVAINETTITSTIVNNNDEFIIQKLQYINVEKYNTEEWQIRWLVDNNFNIHLAKFWILIPKNIKLKTSNWTYMNTSLKLAIKIRKKLKYINIEKYNKENWQIEWLIDNNFNINLAQFNTIVPKNIKLKMYNWKNIRAPLKLTIIIREKLENINVKKYNTYDWQDRWLKDNNLKISLTQFWIMIPKHIRRKMTNWERINLSRKKAEKLFKTYNDIKLYLSWKTDSKIIQRITNILSKLYFLDFDKLKNYIDSAIQNSDFFIDELRINSSIINWYKDLYSFTDQIWIPRISWIIILKLKSRNIRWIKRLSTNWYISDDSWINFEQKCNNYEYSIKATQEDESCTLKDIIFDFILHHKDEITIEEQILLKRITSWNDVKDNDYKNIAKTLLNFPHLIDILRMFIMK